MKALVTGATGFLGGALAMRLASQGWTVTGIGRNASAGAGLKQAGIAFVPAALEDAASIMAACHGQDYVFHCGALSSPWGAYVDFFGSNVTGTVNIIQGCRQHGVRRLVHVSTPSIYFDFTNRYNIAEHDSLPSKPANHYAATKLLAEHEVARAADLGLPVVSIRPRAIFGPGDKAILPRLLAANAQGRLPLIGGGKAVIDLTYIDNVVDALLLCAEAPDYVLGRTYHITNGEPALLADILRRLFELLGEPMRGKRIPYPIALTLAGLLEACFRLSRSAKEPLLTRYTVGVLARSQTLDITAAKRDLGYSPRVSVAEGLARFAASWKKEMMLS